MTEQQTYTLDEARRAIALEGCRQFGHDWDVVDVRTMADPCGTPVAVQCTRCAEHHAVVTEPTDPPPPIE